MKKTVSFVLFILLHLCSGAQGRERLDSLRYIFPEFSQGTVVFSNRQISRGLLNISPLDQSVYFIAPNSDTLYVSQDSGIISVNISGRTFLKWNDSFVEILAGNSTTGVGVLRSTTKVNNAKSGAFGTTSTTSAIRSYAVDATSGILMENIIDDPRNFVYTEVAYLFFNGRFLNVSRQSFRKMFPEKKELIDNIWAESGVAAGDIDSVIAFYNLLVVPAGHDPATP